jgi:hypothetical protein
MISHKHDFELKKYVSMATMALASSGALKATVHITNIDPNVSLELLPSHVIGDTLIYDLDINNDGTVDLQISAIVDFYQYKPHREKQEIYKILAQPTNGTEVLKGLFDAKRFETGQLLPGDDGTWIGDESVGLAAQDHDGNVSGDWAGTNNGYLAVKLNVNNNIHYGWVRLNVNDKAMGCTIEEFAYNDVPSGGLLVGSTVDIPNNTFDNDDFDLEVRGNSLMVRNNSFPANNCVVSVYSIEGKLIKSELLDDINELYINLPENLNVFVIALTSNNKLILSRKLFVN